MVGFLQPLKHLVPLIKCHLECGKASRSGDTSILLPCRKLGFFISLVPCLRRYEPGNILPIYLIVNT